MPYQPLAPDDVLDASITAPRFREERAHPGAYFARTITNSDPGWVPNVDQRLQAIAELAPNWDGYGAPRIRRDVLYFAINLLNKIMTVRSPAPQLVPASHAGLLLEWRKGGRALTIEIESPGDVWVTWEQPGTARQEWPVRYDFESLSTPIHELTS
jgi:hypothetical protein